MLRLGLDCLLTTVVVGGTFFLTVLLGIASRIPVHFAFFGSLAFFFGKYMTSSGFRARHYVTTGTPEVIWKIAGILCWVGSTISIIYEVV